MNIVSRTLEKLSIKRKEMLETMEKGRVESRRIQDQKLREKAKKISESKPSSVNIMRKHLMMRTTNPLDVMKEVNNHLKDRRREEREKT